MLKKLSEPIYSHDERYFSNPGTDTIPTYVLDFPARGGVALIETGEKSIYEMIQANLVNCDLQSVIESCVHSNQLAVYNRDDVKTLIADFTGVDNLADLYVGMKRVENTWDGLPIEVREQFDSDIKKFTRGIGTSEFEDKLSTGFGKYNDSIKKIRNTAPVPDVPPVPISTPEVTVVPKEGEK